MQASLFDEEMLDEMDESTPLEIDKIYGGRLGAFLQKQSLPYDKKIEHAIKVARAYRDKIENEMGADVHISVGGLDSLTLLYFLRKYVKEDIKAISISSLEDKSIQEIHKKEGIIELKPYKSKVQVINEFGFPAISKSKARKIQLLQTPNCEKQTFIHAIMTGDMGAQGKFKHSNKIKLPDKWLVKYAGLYNEHRPDLKCDSPNHKLSSECCLWMKEKPADDWAKEHNSYPYLGLMASEGGQREMGLIKNGCNYFGKNTIRSCPFAIFLRQDILRLAIELEVPIPKVYGTIEQEPDGTLYTTRAQRTGCSMCGFGIHIEKRPHRFDRLREDNPKEWEFWMHNCATDGAGQKFGWGRVLDHIGVEWENPVGALKGQIGFDELIVTREVKR